MRLGGFAHLPRLLDEARAFAAGKNGLYEYGAMMDRHVFTFTGIASDAFIDEVKKGLSDTEMLSWVLASMRPKRHSFEIQQWSAWLETIGPATAKGHAWLSGKIEGYGPNREDVRTYCEHLDLDDYLSFGGRGQPDAAGRALQTTWCRVRPILAVERRPISRAASPRADLSGWLDARVPSTRLQKR